jgi:hypothetical protein
VSCFEQEIKDLRDAKSAPVTTPLTGDKYEARHDGASENTSADPTVETRQQSPPEPLSTSTELSETNKSTGSKSPSDRKVGKKGSFVEQRGLQMRRALEKKEAQQAVEGLISASRKEMDAAANKAQAPDAQEIVAELTFDEGHEDQTLDWAVRNHTHTHILSLQITLLPLPSALADTHRRVSVLILAVYKHKQVKTDYDESPVHKFTPQNLESILFGGLLGDSPRRGDPRNSFDGRPDSMDRRPESMDSSYSSMGASFSNHKSHEVGTITRELINKETILQMLAGSHIPKNIPS